MDPCLGVLKRFIRSPYRLVEAVQGLACRLTASAVLPSRLSPERDPTSFSHYWRHPRGILSVFAASFRLKLHSVIQRLARPA